LLAGALALGAAAAVPVAVGFAQQANAPAAPSGGAEAMPGMGDGEMPMHRMMMRHMMHGMMRGGGDPQERCIDRLAWRAARRAFVASKLDLTAAQRPLWDKVESAAQSEEQKERQLCAALKGSAAPTAVERLDRMQQFLAARLAGVEAAKPAVAALYEALSPAQRAILDHPFGRS